MITLLIAASCGFLVVAALALGFLIGRAWQAAIATDAILAYSLALRRRRRGTMRDTQRKRRNRDADDTRTRRTSRPGTR